MSSDALLDKFDMEVEFESGDERKFLGDLGAAVASRAKPW
jgi:hypothetical protein